MENTNQVYKLKIITKVNEKPRGYYNEKSYFQLDSVDTFCFKAPAGMVYDDVAAVLGRVFREAKLNIEPGQNEIEQFKMQFENLVKQYHFEQVEETENVINLYAFDSKVATPNKKKHVRNQFKAHNPNSDFEWVKQKANNQELDEIYEKINLPTPSCVDLLAFGQN